MFLIIVINLAFLMIDMSLKETNKYRYFNKFDPMEINENTT
jgi:hypothetical protein